MEAPVVASAPAQPAVSTPEISATRDAANKGDFSAFEQAHNAERVGKPMPAVPAPVETPAKVEAVAEVPAEGTIEPPVAETPQQVSKRQQKANDAIRQAVERATAELRAENERLKAVQPRTERPAPPATVPEHTRIAKMPDAPKLADFDSVEEHAAAMALFVHRTIAGEQHARSVGDAMEADTHQVIESFDARVVELEKSKPEIRAKISPLAHALGAHGGPFGVVGRLAAVSEKGPQILEHLADNPETLKALVTLPTRLRGLPRPVQIEQHKQFIAQGIGKLEAALDTPIAPKAEVQPSPSTISAAPPPPPELSRSGSTLDPQAAAFARGDFKTWEQIETQKVRTRRGAA